MFRSHEFTMNGMNEQRFARVLDAEDLPSMVQFWVAHVARDLLRLGVYFRAATLFQQVPGGPRYRTIIYDVAGPDGLDHEDHPYFWVKNANRKTVLDVLAECLRRLGAAGFMKRVPGGENHTPEELPDKWVAYVERHAAVKHGLLSLVGACLDELIVEAELAEIDDAPRAMWWQKWWARMND
ncbi:MAG: hypothetical protein PVJ57_19565 [Phycisphaerae bacterium]|jgi:hypothetical protein